MYFNKKKQNYFFKAKIKFKKKNAKTLIIFSSTICFSDLGTFSQESRYTPTHVQGDDSRIGVLKDAS